jgi:hypothetical protein
MMSLLIPEEGSRWAHNRLGTGVTKYLARSLVQHQWVKLSREKQSAYLRMSKNL